MGGMPITATWDQDSFRWYTDAGGEGTNPIAATNVNPTTLAAGVQVRLRYLVQETNGSNSSETPVFELEYRVDPAGGTAFGSWLPVDSDDTYFDAVSSASVTDNGTTTQQIGAGTFNDGEFSYVDAAAWAPTGAMAATAGNDEYECEWVLLPASAAGNANFEFRPTRDSGTVLDTTTNTTQVSFSPAPVSSTGAQTFGAPTQSASALHAEALTGTGSQILAIATQSGGGGQEIAASAAQSLAAATQAATGNHSVEVPGSGDQSLASATQAATGGEELPGSGDQSLGAPTQTGTGNHDIPGIAGSGAQLAGAATQSAQALEEIAGTGSQIVAAAFQAATGEATFTVLSSGAQSIGPVAQTATGSHSQNAIGAGAQNVGSLSQDATGTIPTSGDGAQILALFAQDATGVYFMPTIECTLVDRNGNALAGLSALSWAWFDAEDPANFVAPTDQGELEATDGSGAIVIELPNSALTAGQVGALVLRSDSGVLFGCYNLEVA